MASESTPERPKPPVARLSLRRKTVQTLLTFLLIIVVEVLPALARQRERRRTVDHARIGVSRFDSLRLLSLRPRRHGAQWSWKSGFATWAKAISITRWI